ncbi:hypothetical protein [Edaphovirga cremea]|uniref:hypothetical protein n=1 Tax=Edaphovirga cremea TaxID=2267246 RepID=UPI003988F320
MAITINSLVKHATGEITGRVVSLISKERHPWAMVDWGGSGISMHPLSELTEIRAENRHKP